MIQRYFWWIDTSGGNRFFLIRLALLCLFWSMISAGFLAMFAKGDLSLAERYAIDVGVVIFAFVQVSRELTQLARCETLRLLPNFESDLVSAVRRALLAVTLLLNVWGILFFPLFFSPAVKNIPPDYFSLLQNMIHTCYAATVITCFQLPVWHLRLQGTVEKYSAKNLGELVLSWPAMLALAAPALVLHWLSWPVPAPALKLMAAIDSMFYRLSWPVVVKPEMLAVALMAITTVLMLLSLPRLLKRRQVEVLPDQAEPLWRRPGMVVFGVVCLLVLSPLAHPWTDERAWSPVILILALPWMGLSAMNRESKILPTLIGRMWLAGLNRTALCWLGLRRLFVAQATEFGVYLAVAGLGWLFGTISTQALLNLALILVAYGWINWTRGVNDILLGAAVKRRAVPLPAWKNFHIAWVVLPISASILIMSIWYAFFGFGTINILPKFVVSIVFGVFVGIPIIATLILACLYCWNLWRQRVTAFSFEETWWFSTRFKAFLLQLMISLPFLMLIVLAFSNKLRSSGSFVALGVAIVLSIAWTLGYFMRRFEKVELW